MQNPAHITLQRLIDHLVLLHPGLAAKALGHLLDDVARVASHIGVIHKGKLRLQGPISELTSQALRVECVDEKAALDALSGEGFLAKVVEDAVVKTVHATTLRRIVAFQH